MILVFNYGGLGGLITYLKSSNDVSLNTSTKDTKRKEALKDALVKKISNIYVIWIKIL
jgi:hypothetical protein